MSEPALVAVMGSCLSRDNFNRQFNADYKRWFAVGPCTNQSSLIALMAPPVDTPWQPAQPMAKYGLWNVESDLSREILELLRAEQPAYVVLDFFGDVHFGVLETADGRVVTNNRWKLHKTDLYPRLLELPGTRAIWWKEDPAEFLARWKQALDAFADFVATACPSTTVVVHRGLNTHLQLTEDGLKPLGDQRPQRHAEWTRDSNAIWAQLDEHAVASRGWASIDLTAEWWVTYEEHPWGPFDVHFTPDYYGRFLAELHGIDVARTLPAADAALVEELRLAARRRVQDELRYWQDLHNSLSTPDRPRRRLLRRRPRRPDLTRASSGPDADRELLAALAPRLDAEQHERLATLPTSADAHIAWLRSVWRPRVEALLGDLRP